MYRGVSAAPAAVAVLLALAACAAGSSGAATGTGGLEGGLGRVEGPAPAAAASGAPVPGVSDLPKWDRTGSGAACAMHYSQTPQGGTATLFTITRKGELVTYVTGRDGRVYRYDEQVRPGGYVFTAPVPLAQVGGMGAVLHQGPDSRPCAIGPGAEAP